jgi:hypothetical protein
MSQPLPRPAHRGRLPWWERALRICLMVTSAALFVLALAAGVPRAHADSVAYSIDVTVRPGYNFANADAADKAVNELCPAEIWQLRNSAAHYRSPAP